MGKLRIHCFQQVAVEGIGCIADWIVKNGHQLTYTRFYESAVMPLLDDFDALLIMGGPMSVFEEDEYPWLADEKRMIREAMELGKPVLGICLGSQLMAAALGARVYPGKQKEIGWHSVSLFEQAGSSILSAIDGATVFHWHGDTFDLPTGASLLVSSSVTPHQAFSYGKSALALQFHLEVNEQSVDGMVELFGDELEPGDFVQSAADILARKDYLQDNNEMMFDILDKLFV